MADDPRLTISERMEAKAASWHKTHDSAHVQEAPETHGTVSSRTAQWQQKATKHEQTQAENPFSGAWKGSTYANPHQGDESYGRPKGGTKTEYRGKQAGVRISSEIVELCNIIEQLGVEQKDGTFAITFGQLFEFYTKISNKLVGMLMRARKQNLVNFEGEMLFQRRDDDKIVWLMQRPEMLMAQIEKQKEQLHQHQQFSAMKK